MNMIDPVDIEKRDRIIEPPHLNWSTVIFRKRRTKNDKQTTKARRDCVEVTAS